jgi:hypothetical protein
MYTAGSTSSVTNTPFHPKGVCVHDRSCLIKRNREDFEKSLATVVKLASSGVYSYALCNYYNDYNLLESCWAHEYPRNKIPLTPKDRSNPYFVAWIMIENNYVSDGLVVVQSNIPPHIVQFVTHSNGTAFFISK